MPGKKRPDPAVARYAPKIRDECDIAENDYPTNIEIILPTFGEKTAGNDSRCRVRRIDIHEQQLSKSTQLGIVSVGNIYIPTNSRDQLAPILIALQWIYCTPAVCKKIFELLERKILPGKSKDKGRPGLNLWQILILGIVRNARDCDYDQLEDLTVHHSLVRQFLNLPALAGSDLTNTPSLTHKTICNNVCHISQEMLHEINKIVAQHGRTLLSKKSGPEEIVAKCDTYVLETNVHFPTDINLLWDATRKTIDLGAALAGVSCLPGWRKHKSIAAALKNKMRVLGNLSKRGGANKPQRLQHVARAYLQQANSLSDKTSATISELGALALAPAGSCRLAELTYFYEMLDKHIDLIERRILQGETIPHSEKVFSLFEPHTQWISKGKAGCPVELGRKLLITTDQHQLILDYQIMDAPNEHPQALATVARIHAQYGAGSIKSISFDKGFSSKTTKVKLQEEVGQLIMPKKGKCNFAEDAEEHQAGYIELRHAHSAVESNINSLEHHGLNRCPDKGHHGYTRSTGLGILAYNLHQIGHLAPGERSRGKGGPETRKEKGTGRSRIARPRRASIHDHEFPHPHRAAISPRPRSGKNQRSRPLRNYKTGIFVLQSTIIHQICF